MDSIESGLGIIGHMLYSFGGGKGSKSLHDFRAYSPPKERPDPISALHSAFGMEAPYGRK